MVNLWYDIPKLTAVDRGNGDEKAVSIIQGFGENNKQDVMGMDGGFTQKELEDLLWRVKQGIQLLKQGKIRYQHPQLTF